ncbi:hypothetical protein [Methylobrevis pamukkalensis]|uniref:MxaH protein n=1 Tax=Methylobrevis pamukkalensis TaxID=1439726 RepID=A0A1E3H8I5_9HYPH|nr:hypothetical protein [Methylobrevis pamukkalensis]ODN71811.1 mxaH protein [Methylobrevis pamukkalensis]
MRDGERLARRSARSRRQRRALPALVFLLAVAGCDDAPVTASPPPSAAEAPADEWPAGDWLTVDDEREPARWLAERFPAAPGSVPERAARLGAALDRAEAVYHDTRRMLANRVAQVAEVSGEYGSPESPEAVLADLTLHPVHGGQLWFGVVSQAYIELRRGGRSHAAAVDEVRTRFAAGETTP